MVALSNLLIFTKVVCSRGTPIHPLFMKYIPYQVGCMARFFFSSSSFCSKSSSSRGIPTVRRGASTGPVHLEKHPRHRHGVVRRHVQVALLQELEHPPRQLRPSNTNKRRRGGGRGCGWDWDRGGVRMGGGWGRLGQEAGSIVLFGTA